MGGSVTKGSDLYLHIFEWGQDGTVSLPPLPRHVLACHGLGGEEVTCSQTAGALTLRLSVARAGNWHSVVKLSLSPGDDLPLLAVVG